MTIEEALTKLYAHEINVEISSFWDGGFTVRIGDDMNGFKAKESDIKPSEIAETLWRLAKSVYPLKSFESTVSGGRISELESYGNDCPSGACEV